MRSKARRGVATAGFTLVEVLVSLTILVVAATALTVLQRNGSRANAFARRQSIALEIAERWATRFKQDAQSWTQVGIAGGTPGLNTVLQNTMWLSRVVAQPNVFQTINTTAAPVSRAFDFYGNDVLNPTANSQFTFCAAFRPNWVYTGRTIRLDIRVWWRRDEDDHPRPAGGTAQGTWIEQDFPQCANNHATLDAGGNQLPYYHVIYLPVVVSMTTNTAVN